MKSLPSKQLCTSDIERGAILPLVALSIIVLFVMTGLAIDGGRFFLIQEQLQRAVDVAALSSVKFVTDTNAANVIQTADSIFRDNLELNGLARDAATAEISLEPAAAPIRVRVSATMSGQPFILHFPGFAQQVPIRATATAEYNRFIITLALDISGSMGCPADGSYDCAASGCLDTNSCPAPHRIDTLKEAAHTLIHNLQPDRDKLSIISFNGNVTTNLHYRAAPGFDQQEADNQIDLLQLGPSTHTGSALHAAREGFQLELPATAQGTRTVIVITDGAPIGDDTGITSNMTPGRCREPDFSGNGTQWNNSASPLYAIWEADRLRNEPNPIHVDAIGFEHYVANPAEPTTHNQLYQMTNSQWWLNANRYMNERLVNSPAIYNPQRTAYFQGTHDDGSPCSEIPLPTAGGSLASQRRGTYLPVYDPDDINDYILALGIHTRERLVE